MTKNQNGSTLTIVIVILLVVISASLVGWRVYEHKQAQEIARLEQQKADAKIAEIEKKNQQNRDEQRKKDLQKVIKAAKLYAANNDGRWPNDAYDDEFYKDYLLAKNKDFRDPKTKEFYKYWPVVKVQSPPPLELGTFQLQQYGKCFKGEIIDTESPYEIAVTTLLEGGVGYCVDFVTDNIFN